MPSPIDAIIRERQALVRAAYKALECRLTGGEWWPPLEAALGIPPGTIKPVPPPLPPPCTEAEVDAFLGLIRLISQPIEL